MKCSDCGSDKNVTNYKTGETCCRHCGLVLERAMVNEEQSYDVDGKPTGSSKLTTNAHNEGLGTVIHGHYDGKGKKLTSKQIKKTQKLVHIQRLTRIFNHEQSLVSALGHLFRIVASCQLPDSVRTESAYFLKKLHKDPTKNQLAFGRGKPTKILAAISVFTSCRRLGIPLTLNELAPKASLPKKVLARNYTKLSRILKLNTPMLKPSEYVPKIVFKLKLSQKTAQDTISILGKVSFPPSSPIILTAGAIYYTARRNKEERSYKQVSNATLVSEPSIRTIVRVIEKQERIHGKL